jgi:tetratricopeptide (TPR) repeat protein
VTLETGNNEIRKRAIRLMEQREWQAALKDWDVWFSSTEKENLDPNAFHDRAICKFHTGNKDSAIDDLDEAVNLQPDYSYRFASRGWMKQAAGDSDGALDDYKHAIQLDPDDAIAHNNLGLLEETKGYKAQAEERFKVADELQEILDHTEVITEEEVKDEDVDQIKKEFKLEEDNKVKETRKTIWGEVKSVFTDNESRGLWWRFIRNGFTLKD